MATQNGAGDSGILFNVNNIKHGLRQAMESAVQAYQSEPVDRLEKNDIRTFSNLSRVLTEQARVVVATDGDDKVKFVPQSLADKTTISLTIPIDLSRESLAGELSKKLGREIKKDDLKPRALTDEEIKSRPILNLTSGNEWRVVEISLSTIMNAQKTQAAPNRP